MEELDDIEREGYDMEQPEYSKSEMKMYRLMQKLEALQEKLQTDPPKTMTGKRLAMARLNRLENLVDMKILQNDIKVQQAVETRDLKEAYANQYKGLMREQTGLLRQKDMLLAQIHRLEVYDPRSNNFAFADKRNDFESRVMTDGYRMQPEAEELTPEQQQIDDLYFQLDKIENEIEINNGRMDKYRDSFDEKLEEINQRAEERLAIAKPGLFTRIKNAITNRIDSIKQKREEKKERVANEYTDKVESSMGTKREAFLKANAANLSLQDQAKLSQRIQEGMDTRGAQSQPEIEQNNERE